MKKIFTLLVAFLALTFCAKAQVTIVLEAHDVWGDGSGYQLLLDADHNTYGTVIPTSGPLTSSGDAPASVYAEFEYTVPVHADGSLTTTNIVMDGSATITIPAGTYDFCITNPTPGDKVWIAGEGIDPTRGDDYEFLDGRIYHFLMARNGSNDGCTMTITYTPTVPTITATPSSLNFGAVILGNTANSTITVNNYLLTTDVTAVTAAPFEISADGTNFGTTATIPAAGGILNVRYTPTAVATDNGSITLSSNGVADVTILLTGSGLDCSNITIPYSFNFDNEAQAECWQIVDANNDGSSFTIDVENSYAYYIYNTANNADDWLISPAFTFTGGEMASFDYSCASAYYPEKFQAFAIGSDTVALTAIINVTSTEPTTQYLDLSSLNGVYSIALHCVSDADEYAFIVENFSVFSAGAASITVAPTSIDFGMIPTGNTANSTVDLTVLNASADITVSTAAPFSVSLDNTTYTTSLTIPTPAAVYNQTIYVAYNPTAAGNDNGQLSVSTTGASETVTLSGIGITCETITSFPFTETFDETSLTRECWTIVDANNDDNSIEFLPYDDNNTGVAAYFYSTTSGAEDWLISPEIALPAGGSYVSYEYAVGNAIYPEKYSVWVIPQGGTYATATNILPTQTVTSSDITTNVVNLSSYANQTISIAFKVESDADMYYLFFDNVTIAGVTAPTVTISGPSTATTGSPATFTANAPLATSFAWTVDGTAVSSTTNTMTHTFTTGGNHTVAVTATNSEGSNTASMTVNVISCDGAQNLPFSEDFEGGIPACWTILDQDGDGYSWEHSYEPVSYYPSSVDLSGSGNNGSDGFILSGSYSNVVGVLTPDNWLITPALAIPSNGAKLTWYVSAIDADYAAEYYDVMLSTSLNPSNFTSVFNETLQYDEWEQRSIDINGNWAGQTVYIAFRNHNTENIFLMKIDDINVTPGTGVENHELNTTIFPNPANNVLNINANSNINRVEVYNMMGQMVGSYNVNDVNTQISTTSFANGVYTVKIATENGMSTQKFTVAR